MAWTYSGIFSGWQDFKFSVLSERARSRVGERGRRHLHVLHLGDGEFQSHTVELKVTT